MRHLDPTLNPDSQLKVRRDSRRTSLAELIPDWPVLTQRKKFVKVIFFRAVVSFYFMISRLMMIDDHVN